MVGLLIRTSFFCVAFLSIGCTRTQEAPQSQINSNINTNKISVVEVPANATVTDDKPVDYFAHLRLEHREVLRRWMKSKPFLRPGEETTDSILFPGNDSASPEGNMKWLRETVGEKGHQYYSVGDMNQDGKVDFAVLLVDTREHKDDNDQFALAIFNAPFGTKSAPAYFEKGLHGISNSYIVFDLMEKNHLFLGKFESDVYCATYYSKGSTYFFKDCIE